MNHSEDPNCGSGEEQLSSYAIKDIKKGEELLDDYGTFEWPAWIRKLLKEYDVPTDYFTHNKNFNYAPEYKGTVRGQDRLVGTKRKRNWTFIKS